jgi:hypothetical protein
VGGGSVWVFAVVSGAGVVAAGSEADSADVSVVGGGAGVAAGESGCDSSADDAGAECAEGGGGGLGVVAGGEVGVGADAFGTLFKPSALRSYERDLPRRVLPEFGHLCLSSVSRNQVQDFANRLVGEGCSPSAVRKAVLPLRAIYRRAVDRGEVD